MEKANRAEMLEALEKAQGKRILVVGDLMLDQGLIGTASRLCPEAPVPILVDPHTDSHLGGAANTALCLKNLGAEVSVAGMVGDDADGAYLKKLLEAEGIAVETVGVAPGMPTTTKLRIFASNRMIVRVDTGERTAVHHKILEIIRKRTVDAAVVSDYNKGVVTPTTVAVAREASRDHTYVDPKVDDWSRYGKGHVAIFPNLKEAAAAVQQRDCGKGAMCYSLRCEWNHKAVIITMGSRGCSMSAEGPDDLFWAKAISVTEVDPTGAGDVFTAAYVMADIGDAKPRVAARFANLAAGLSVTELGTYPPTLAEVLEFAELNEILAGSKKEV